MTDKKNEDYAVNLNDGQYDKDEMDNYARGLPKRAQGASLASISNSPPLSIAAYCIASISMTVVNKYVVSGQKWNLGFFYLFVQAVVSTLTIVVLSQVGVMKLSGLDPERAKKWFPITLLLVGMIYTSTKALQFLSVPVYTIFKNLTIIVIAYGEVLWFGGRVSPMSLLSFGLMVLSSVVAAWADIQSALAGDFGMGDTTTAVATLNAGYAWMGMNVFCSAAYVLGMRKAMKKLNLKDSDTSLYNNLLSVPVLFFCGLLTEDWSAANFAANFPIESRNRMIIGIIYSGIFTIGITYCSAWCIRVTSSTTYSMVGALNKLPLAVCGLIFFAAPVTVGSVSAIIIGFVSGLVYSWAKISQSKQFQDSLPTSRPPMSASSQSNRDANS